MLKKQVSIVSLLALCGIFFTKTLPEKAVCIVPVADLVRRPITESNAAAYQEIPLSWGPDKKDLSACPRTHQLIFNEIVTILGENEHEFFIEVPNVIYQTLEDTQDHNCFWTHKNNLLSFSQLAHKGITPESLPKPITMYPQNSDQAATNTITLLQPWHSNITHCTYSAGTRFTLASTEFSPSQNIPDTNETYRVFAFNSELLTLDIPKNLCFRYADQSRQERITLFVSLLRSWTQPDTNTGVIPLVWGGCSFCSRRAPTPATLASKTIAGQSCTYWIHPDCTTVPHRGFDTSGLIIRAAQILAIPFFYKNTAALSHLDPLTKENVLQDGDIIWVPGGGAMVISSLAENKILAARGYQFGYGSVIEVPLQEFFAHISTYQDLLEAYFGQKPVDLIDNHGTFVRAVDHITILKLNSAWKDTSKQSPQN